MVLGLEIQLQEGSPTFDRWVGIIAIKTEGTQIQFLSNVLVAVRRWILKSLIDDQRVPSNDPRNNCGTCFSSSPLLGFKSGESEWYFVLLL